MKSKNVDIGVALWCLVFYDVQKTHVVASIEAVFLDKICYILLLLPSNQTKFVW